MKKYLYQFYLNKIIIPRYIKNSMTFGDMLSYSYMGKAVGFDLYEKRNFKYASILIKNNIKPFDYNEMASVGWGRNLPPLENFNSEEDKEIWLEENKIDQVIVKEVQKTNLASKLMSRLKS